MDVSGLMIRDATSRTSGCDIMRFMFRDLLSLDSHLDTCTAGTRPAVPETPWDADAKSFLHDVGCVIHAR